MTAYFRWNREPQQYIFPGNPVPSSQSGERLLFLSSFWTGHPKHRSWSELPDLTKSPWITELNFSGHEVRKLPDLSRLKNLYRLYCERNKLTDLPDLTELP